MEEMQFQTNEEQPTSLTNTTLTVGDLVYVRARQYLVEKVEHIRGMVTSPDDRGELTWVNLSCIEDDAQGEPLEVIWEQEVDARVLRDSSWGSVARRGFDQPSQFSAYLNALRWNCVTSTERELFQAPDRSGIDVMAYQLEPLKKALAMPRVNLFIADDVGLGKTIEAGLILREMLLRQKIKKVVIACPPSVVVQWQQEMERRFGLSFLIYDRTFVAKRRRERGFAINPWTTHTRFIISHALLRNEQYTGPLRDWLGTDFSGSMLILDEAHNAAPASSSVYAVDSHLTRQIRELAPRFEHRLFLSATPHNGHSNSFSALLEILDPQRFCRGVPVHSKLLEPVMVRRLKEDLRGIGQRFPERIICEITLDNLPKNTPELELSRWLQQYRKAREKRLESKGKKQQATAMLVLTNLQKRLLSSIPAFARTLRVHRNTLARYETLHQEGEQTALLPSQISLLESSLNADDERASWSLEEVEAEEESAIAHASRAHILLSPEENELLEKMTTLAEASSSLPDTRVTHLIQWLKENLCPDIGANKTTGASWANKRVILFTEYTDTMFYLKKQLEIALLGTSRAEERIQLLHGGLGEDSREEIKRAFNAKPESEPLRILIATDSAREGINLQNHCADLFHVDIPWNPSRLEQRNGRIDRKGQPSPTVRCHYFTLPQRAEDRVLRVLVEKTKIIQEQLGSLSPILHNKIKKLFQQGITNQDDNLLSQLKQVEQVESLKPKQRERELQIQEDMGELYAPERSKLQRQIDSLRNTLKKSRDWMRFDEERFRHTISTSLQLLGSQPLKRRSSENSHLATWEIPHLEDLFQEDDNWKATLDSLRPPRPRKQKVWDWREETSLLPLVFEDSGKIDNDVVHLHLEQRLVQRLLGRLLAQGFVHHELSRACVCPTKNTTPLVLLLGRLSLYGNDASRLHDELIVAGAEWTPASQRTRKLKPLLLREKESLLSLLENSLLQAEQHPLETAEIQFYSQSVTQDVKELRTILEARAESTKKRSEGKLQRRAREEAEAMQHLLLQQQKRIEKKNAEVSQHFQQMSLGFNKAEERQLRADQSFWLTRLKQIEDELISEPARILTSYEVKLSRVEPVGILYLHPISG